MEYKRAKKRWRHFLILWALILLIIGAAGCIVLYKYLDVYEQTRPEIVIEEFLRDQTAESIVAMAQKNMNLELTEFEDASVLYEEYLSTVDTSLPLTYRSEKRLNTNDLAVYAVRSGPSDLCYVELVPTDDAPGFGRHHWTVGTVSPSVITERLNSTVVTIDTLAGNDVYLNGRPVGSSYLTEEHIDIPDLTPLESSFPDAPFFVRYTVSPLYGDISVQNASGEELNPDRETADGVHYQADSGSHTLSITAPNDVRVSVNGIPLTEKDIVSSSPGILKDLELYTGETDYRVNEYRFEGLYSLPEISAVDSQGNELIPVNSAEGKYTFFSGGDPSLAAEYQPIAERFFHSYMNYSANAFDETRYWNLLSRILPGTELYNYIARSREAMVWASKTATEYKDLRYENFQQVGDYCFTCTVIYSAELTATSWYEQYSYMLENAYELAFVTTSGNWFAAAMSVIAD
ncbi:MAG: hypothetical protein IKT07_02925 [Oscillospiraceae bacterium]|nr:hypothetical protein [Oscillospiraceae bacterium]